MKKIKVLIGCLLFRNYTGSEMYVYELAKNLIKLNCDVTIVSANIGGPLTDLGIKEGIKIYSFQTLPKNIKFDIIHCQHTPVVTELIRLFPHTKKICTIHSEVISLENPVLDFSILKYIAIRPEIKEHLIKNFGLLDRQIEVIYNPIDETKFNTENTTKENALLFVGTIDYLRKYTIYDLVDYTKNNNKELWLVGKNHENYLPDILKNNHVKYFDATINVDEYVKRCSETGGILLGRTTIEGWMCGKPGWIYEIDNRGIIINKTLTEVPNDIEKFYSKNVTEKIKNEYEKILK